MKAIYLLTLSVLFINCSLDNKSYPIQLENIKKENDKYRIEVSLEKNLLEIKNKHQFSEEKIIGSLPTRNLQDKNVIIIGDFSTAEQKLKENRYYYQGNIIFTNKNDNDNTVKELNDNDTIELFLQLSYQDGRTYPTKSLKIPAKKFKEL